MKIFFPVVRFIAYGLICAKIILDFLEKGYSKKELALIVIVGTLFLVSAYVTKDKNLLIYWVFIVAAHDVDFQDIIKWSLWVHVGAVLFVIGSCYGGYWRTGSMYKKAANESGTAWDFSIQQKEAIYSFI